MFNAIEIITLGFACFFYVILIVKQRINDRDKE